MPDPTTPEAHAELRAAAEAVGKRTRWNWDMVGENFYVHEFAWNVATISCGAIDPTEVSDDERQNIERRIATFIAAADPETVCTLLDTIDRQERELDDRRAYQGMQKAALARVRALTYADTSGSEWVHVHDDPKADSWECPACWAADIRRALDSEQGR